MGLLKLKDYYNYFSILIDLLFRIVFNVSKEIFVR